MLFLSSTEKKQWVGWFNEIRAHNLAPGQSPYAARNNLRPAFDFYCGTMLAADGNTAAGRAWMTAGAMIEDDGLFLNTFLAGFLERHAGRLAMPEQVFADPRPYVHFTTVPIMRESRLKFMEQCAHSLSERKKPLRMLDIGCGDGGLTARLLQHLRAAGRVGDIGEIMLVDPSAGMLELARRTVAGALPGVKINVMRGRIEEIAGRLEGMFDLAVCSLSYHHMPYEKKIAHLRELKPHLDNLILFELDANNDLPELHTPELALSIYQSYARLADFVFSHDAPVEVAQDCVDRFLMTEVVSLLTQARGLRNDYHMLRRQWLELFEQELRPEFECRCDSSCYDDEYFALFTIHYARV